MRINRVKHAAKPGVCEVCPDAIEVGQPYNWIKSRYGPKRSRHAACRGFRPSDLTSNDKLSRLYAIQERIEDEASAWGLLESADLDDLVTALDDAVSEAREVADEYRETAENLEQGFGHSTSQSEEIASNGDEIDGWADELETLSSELEAADPDQDGWDAVAWQDGIANQVSDVVGSLPL